MESPEIRFARSGDVAIAYTCTGGGPPDRVREVPTLETRMDDVRAVLDVVSSRGRRCGSPSAGSTS